MYQRVDGCSSWRTSDCDYTLSNMDHNDHVNLLRPANLNQGGAWADLGAGSGVFTLALRELVGLDAIIYAVDKDQSALRELENSQDRKSTRLNSSHGYI